MSLTILQTHSVQIGEVVVNFTVGRIGKTDSQAKATEDNGATAQAEQRQADSVAGVASRPSVGGGTDAEFPESDGGAIARIELSQGRFATIDAADASAISKHKWFAVKSKKTFYAARMDHENDGVCVYMHRELIGADPGQIVDHSNRDGLDNRRSNLRIANNSLNAANAEMQSNNTSGLRGVWRAGNRWKARVFVDGEDCRLGSFLCKYDAADAYDRAAKEAFGDFAFQNSEHNPRPEICACGCRPADAVGVEPPPSETNLQPTSSPEADKPEAVANVSGNQFVSRRTVLRPHCLRPDKCGGYGKNHCNTCLKAAAEGEAA